MPHWRSRLLTATAFAVSFSSPITIRCGSGVPLGVSGSPTDAFHWCGPIPPGVGVHAAEEYAGAVKVGVEVAVAFVTAPTLSNPKHVIMTIT